MQLRQQVKTIRVTGTSALFLFFGIALAANAQEKPEEKSKPAQQEQAKPQRQEQAKPEKQEQAKPTERQQQVKPEKQEQAKTPKQESQAKPEKQQQQAKTQQQPHKQQVKSSQAPQRTQEAIAKQHSQPTLRLSARGSGRIPDDRFRSNFGRGHNFRMGNPVFVSGYSRFQYGGFWFGFVEPWPADWYYTDDVYIDYVDGGYYMYNPYHPGARFLISVVI
jgi:flagellar motor protein MotB